MTWSEVKFGKHKSKTLPQIVFSDPDWFFWAFENGVFYNKGNLDDEASDLNYKARNIRPPEINGENMVAEYVIHPPTGKFAHMDLVPQDDPIHDGASLTIRCDVIDLSIPRQIDRYDKLGCKMLISSVKFYLFGKKNTRMTKSRCGEFFDDNENFIYDYKSSTE